LTRTGRIRFLLAVAGVVLLAAPYGCGGQSNSTPLISRDATVRFEMLEGGFFALIGDDNTPFDPDNLPADFRQDGLRVHFIASRSANASVHQFGTAIDIVSLTRL
jgi:hypothetical protein